MTGIVAAIALPPSPSYTTGSLVCDRLLHIVVPVLTFVGWVVFGPRGKVHPRGPAALAHLAGRSGSSPPSPSDRSSTGTPTPSSTSAPIGLGRTLLNCAVIAVLFLALAALALWADRRLSRDRATMNA